MLIMIVLVILIGFFMLVPVFQKPDIILIKQAHRAERFKFNTQIELHSMDHDGVYPKSMTPADWWEFFKYFPEQEASSPDVNVPLYCNQGSEWEINPDHKLSLLGHGGHE